jgi:DNA-binding response OmpR family regulator
MGTRVAVVDDDRDVREALQDALEQAGYDVFVVPNGLKLLSMLAIDRPDLILLDVAMSWIDGVDLCRALKANPAYSAIPVVFISAMTSDADVQRGMRAGAEDYIRKPFDLDFLLRRVKELTEAAAKRRAELEHHGNGDAAHVDS